MIWYIAKKEFRLNLLSARFVIALLLCLLLVPVTMIVSVDNFKNQYRAYQVAKRGQKKNKIAGVFTLPLGPLLYFPHSP